MKKPKKEKFAMKRVRDRGKRKPAKKKLPGRKRKKVTKPNREMLKRLARAGGTNEQLAAAAGVSERTFYRLMDFDPELKREIDSEKGVADDKMEIGLYARGRGIEYEEVTMEPALVVRSQVDGQTQTSVLKEELIVTKRVKKFEPPETKAIMSWLTNRRREQWKNRQTMEDQDGNALAPAYVVPGFKGGLENGAAFVPAAKHK